MIQDAHGHLPSALLAALAQEMRLPFAEVFEVASFYAHFDLTDARPDGVAVRVCDGIACALQGAEALAARLEGMPGAQRAARALHRPLRRRPLRAGGAACHRPCVGGAGGRGGRRRRYGAAHASLHRRRRVPRRPAAMRCWSICAAAPLTAEAVLDELDEAKLAGMGGAGFPTGRKWRAVRAQPAPRLLAVNADEGEPGTFKDRFYLERDPHRFLEGILIAAEVVQAEAAYVYVRDEYPAIRAILAREVAHMPPGGPRIELRRGAGAYICGEESAMIESIEGKRGLPRHKPPLVFQHGLFGRPTLVNNVETLWWVRDIVERGAEWWARAGAARPHRAAQLFRLRPGAQPGREAGAGRHHRAPS